MESTTDLDSVFRCPTCGVHHTPSIDDVLIPDPLYCPRCEKLIPLRLWRPEAQPALNGSLPLAIQPKDPDEGLARLAERGELTALEQREREELVASHIRLAMKYLGTAQDSGSAETPERVARFLLEFHQPCDLGALLKAFEHEDAPNGGMPMVVQQGIPFQALCQHHWAPFFGTCDIGYVPGKIVVGLSKMVRLARAAGRVSPTIQEKVTNEIADAIDKALEPKGVIVVIRAQHTCMTCRGVATPGVWTVTSAVRSIYVHNPTARMEFFELLKVRG